MMGYKHIAIFALAIAMLASACGATFTINLDNPPSGPDITGQGWENPCTASRNSCPLYCGRFENHDWMPGYYFDSPIAGTGTCTLTLKATSYSVIAGTGPDQTNEVVEAQVNGVVFDKTEDICTGLGASCACNIATKVSTRTVPLTATGNHITVRMPGDSIAVKGAILTCSVERTCDEGWDDEYQCQGHSLMRKWIQRDCGEEWRQYEYCDYGCEDDECIIGCDSGYTGNYTCNGNWLQRQYQNYDCTRNWQNYQYCSYGCSGSSCNPPHQDPYCTDSDGGIIYNTQGNTYGINDLFASYSKSDYCSGNILYEYYCNGTNWNVTTITCTGSCSNGRCIDPGCTDECGTLNLRECYSSGYRICGYYDTDYCLDWSYNACGPNEDCSNGYCDGNNECDDVGWENDYRCSGNWQQRLYTYDDGGDCEEEWRNYEYCTEGCSNDECNDDNCGNGICSNGETCSTCPTDCGQCGYCGNGICSNGETCSTCPTDCGSCNTCGNGVCGLGESCSNCPTDCGQCGYCGNGVCSNGETCSTCPTDCGSCARCGDGFCTGGETCSLCPSDCGSCITACAIPIGENVEVSAVACVEFKGTGMDVFNLTIYSKEDHEAAFSIRLTGQASPWSVVVPSTLDIPARRNATAQIRVTMPDGIAHGLYNLTAIVSSGGEDIAEKKLFVSVSEPVEPGEQPVAVITASPQTPTGGVVIGELGLIWVLIALGTIVNLALLYVLVERRRGKSAPVQ